MSHYKRAQQINKSVVSFQKYAFKVSEIINRTHPQVNFDGRKLFLHYASRITASNAAKIIINSHRIKNRG